MLTNQLGLRSQKRKKRKKERKKGKTASDRNLSRLRACVRTHAEVDGASAYLRRRRWGKYVRAYAEIDGNFAFRVARQNILVVRFLLSPDLFFWLNLAIWLKRNLKMAKYMWGVFESPHFNSFRTNYHQISLLGSSM
jgi:hypothetical protein